MSVPCILHGMGNLPSGTVTFLFTDIENSTQLAREYPQAWEAAQARHHAILREAIESNNGYVFQIIGDAFCAAFHRAGDALKAAVNAQENLQNGPWGEVTIYVRMGIHTGEAELEGDDYRGYTTLSFVQRIMSAGHGGQILVSNATENLLREHLPPQISLRNMGIQKFAGMPSPVRIFQAIAPDLPREFPPLRTLENLPNNLPTQLTSFVGRQKELGDVKRLLQNAHLLTLIGPGGTGKTRLSIQAASEILEQYPDGVWFVELAPILDPLLVPRTVATALGLRDEPQRPVIDMLCDYLHEKKILIILDNCEHLVDACARMSDRILRAAPHTRILASSREALGIGGEVTYRVPSLGLPDVNHLPPVESLNQYEAVKLFIDRATAAIPSFAVTNENAPALAQVCHHLDGVPLAIELAAAKIRVLSVEQIANRLGDRFKLLIGGSRTVLERHQTLRAAIDWSYNLLPSDEQILFRRLSVFVDRWTLEAAELICEGAPITRDDILNLLEQLINKSLVVKEEEPIGTRYRMLETIRQYANEKLVEAEENDTLRDRHLEYFLTFSKTAEPHLIRPEQIEWLPLLDAEYENLRFAFEWALTKESAESSLSLSKSLGWFWEIRGFWLEGLSWLANSLAKSSQNESRNEKVARAQALYQSAALHGRLGNREQMLSSARESLALASKFSDERDVAIARFFVGAGELHEEKREQAYSLLQQSLSEFQALREPFWEALAFFIINDSRAQEGQLKFRDFFLRLIELSRKAGERFFLAESLSAYANWLFRMGHEQEARQYAEESDRYFMQIGSAPSNENAYLFAEIAWENEDYRTARSLFAQLVEHFRLLGDSSSPPFFMAKLGILAIEEGDLQLAEVELKEALLLTPEQNKPLRANRLVELSKLSYLQGNLEEFQQHVREAFALKNYFVKFQKTYLLLCILPSIYAQKPEDATRIMGVFESMERDYDYPPRAVDRKYYDQAKVHARQSLGNAAFEAFFAEGQQMTIDEALDLAWKTAEEITEIKLPSGIDMESNIPATLPSQREAEKQKYGGLTSREREVAAQIAQGKSNQAIAAELFVGLKTVEAHVTRTLSKLGFTSRAQIAGWAISKGLAEAPQDLDTLGREI
jgi:predicted ATPase/class 3 adenylate cyclase/DNA-binding CsgD family transcriptional regulator